MNTTTRLCSNQFILDSLIESSSATPTKTPSVANGLGNTSAPSNQTASALKVPQISLPPAPPVHSLSNTEEDGVFISNDPEDMMFGEFLIKKSAVTIRSILLSLRPS